MRLIVSSLAVAGLLLATSVPAVVQEADSRPAQVQAAKPATAVVNLNTATAAQLEELPGIGPATARRIIEYREKIGGFKKIEELMNVRGIGEKSFLKLRPLVVVTPPKPERATSSGQ
jgi:comEA protein